MNGHSQLNSNFISVALFKIHYARFHYASQRFHNKIGIEISVLLKLSGDIFFNRVQSSKAVNPLRRMRSHSGGKLEINITNE